MAAPSRNLQNRREKVFSEDFVPSVPLVGVGGTIWSVQVLARGPYQVDLLSAGDSGHQEARLTASPARL